MYYAFSPFPWWAKAVCRPTAWGLFWTAFTLSNPRANIYIQHIVRIGITVIVVYSALALSVWERASSASGRPYTHTAYYLDKGRIFAFRDGHGCWHRRFVRDWRGTSYRGDIFVDFYCSGSGCSRTFYHHVSGVHHRESAEGDWAPEKSNKRGAVQITGQNHWAGVFQQCYNK